MATENLYQARLIKKLYDLFPGCIVIKTDSQRRQGMPDLVILWKRFWAALEVKASGAAPSRPNQAHYVEQLNDMAFAAFIYPEIEEEVLSALQQAFRPPRRARVS